MFTSNYLFLVGIPLLLAMWAQFRVSGAFKKWGEVRASSNVTGAEAAREILKAAQIHDDFEQIFFLIRAVIKRLLDIHRQGFKQEIDIAGNRFRVCHITSHLR